MCFIFRLYKKYPNSEVKFRFPHPNRWHQSLRLIHFKICMQKCLVWNTIQWFETMHWLFLGLCQLSSCDVNYLLSIYPLRRPSRLQLSLQIQFNDYDSSWKQKIRLNNRITYRIIYTLANRKPQYSQRMLNVFNPHLSAPDEKADV